MGVRADGHDRDHRSLILSQQNGLLGLHPILTGRDGSERVANIRSFTGQSLSVPAGAAILLKLGAMARSADSQ